MRLQYPKVWFHFDYAGLAHTKTQSGMMKAIQHSKGFPDLMIVHPTKGALFLELKAEGERIEKRDGSYANEHIEQQFGWLKVLQDAGFGASFAVGFDQAKQIIDTFLKN